MSIDEALFANPPAEFRIVSQWRWTTKVCRDAIVQQLGAMKDKGIGGFFITPFGASVEPSYLSDEWFEMVRFAVREAEKRELSVWIYDELDWPSGTAGGKVVEQAEYRMRFLQMEFKEVSGPGKFQWQAPASTIWACAVPAERRRFVLSESIPLGTDNISWSIPEGKWNIVVVYEKTEDAYLDIFKREAVQRFIDCTHEAYRKGLDGDFNAIKGFFTDEPLMLPFFPHLEKDVYTIPWTEAFSEKFQQRYRYDLRPYLPALFLRTEPACQFVRLHYWVFIAKLFDESYFAPVSEWCERNGVLLTGHVWPEEPLRPQIRFCGNSFEHLRYFHIPGIDHLGNDIVNLDTGFNVGKINAKHLVPKIASSAVHIYGKKRVLSESFGAAGWGLTLQEQKWILSWEYVLGVNFLNNFYWGYPFNRSASRLNGYPQIKRYVSPDVRIVAAEGEARSVWYLHRIREGNHLYFFANLEAEEQSLTVTVEEEGEPWLWNLDTGSIGPLYVWKTEENSTDFQLHLPGFGSALVVLKPIAEHYKRLSSCPEGIEIDGIEQREDQIRTVSSRMRHLA